MHTVVQRPSIRDKMILQIAFKGMGWDVVFSSGKCQTTLKKTMMENKEPGIQAWVYFIQG